MSAHIAYGEREGAKVDIRETTQTAHVPPHHIAQYNYVINCANSTIAHPSKTRGMMLPIKSVYKTSYGTTFYDHWVVKLFNIIQKLFFLPQVLVPFLGYAFQWGGISVFVPGFVSLIFFLIYLACFIVVLRNGILSSRIFWACFRTHDLVGMGNRFFKVTFEQFKQRVLSVGYRDEEMALAVSMSGSAEISIMLYTSQWRSSHYSQSVCLIVFFFFWYGGLAVLAGYIFLKDKDPFIM
jgi:hypothetical protein